MKFKPFFINSNICLNKEDIQSFDSFMNAVAGNTGNSYITYALLKELGVDCRKLHHIQNIYTYDFKNMDSDIEQIRSSYSHLFLILQDQIRISESYGLQLPYDNIEQFIEKSQKQVVIVGLGANSFNGFDPLFYKQLNPNLINFLHFLSDHTLEVGVRGNFTAEVLGQLGIKNVRVIGCPSFYEMGSDRFINKSNDISLRDVCATGYNPITSLGRNHYVCQDKYEASIIEPIAFGKLFDSPNLNDWIRFNTHKYHVFSDINSWKEFLTQFKFLIGTRLHGSICALNAGVPAMCTNGDSRAREMCEFLHIPYYSKIDENTDVLELYKRVDIDKLNRNYPILFENFRDFILKNVGIEIFNHVSFISQPSITLYSTRYKLLKFLQQVFSVRNEGNHKVLRILGLKIKFRKKTR